MIGLGSDNQSMLPTHVSFDGFLTFICLLKFTPSLNIYIYCSAEEVERECSKGSAASIWGESVSETAGVQLKGRGEGGREGNEQQENSQNWLKVKWSLYGMWDHLQYRLCCFMVKGRSSGDGGVQIKGREEGEKESNGSEHSRIIKRLAKSEVRSLRLYVSSYNQQWNQSIASKETLV